MINELEKLLGNSFSNFQKTTDKNLEKLKHNPNENNYSVLYNRNEYMFENDKIYSIEFENIKYLKKKYPNFSISKRLEKNLRYLTEKNIKWEVFSKYSYKKHVVIKVKKYVFYEYVFEDEKFELKTIRVSNRE